jgi:CheY-like chemotaxis protein
MSLLLGKRLTEASGGHVRLYSDYPFPWRTPAETKLDEFQVKALATLRASPDEPVVNFFEIDGQMVVRYAAADRMREACVQCHNTHPDSPKRDWKTGDVRGVFNGLKNVLVVDDDATVRDMTVSMLKENGFKPEAATSGAEAVQRIQEKGSPIDAVILDVCMPGEHGLEVYKTLIQHQPTLAVLFMSGFAVDEEIRTLVSQGQVSLLTKPFTMYDLSKALSGLRLRAKTESSTLP